ncbi:MAG: protein kinase domain-containing protein [Gemmatimonadales bacterium]
MTAAFERLTTALADRYRLERELGQGGMATVYLAADLKHERKVAVKVLKPELAAVLGADRFVVEIKTTAALQHPHILPLFDSGECDGFLYYVMPYIQGETLRSKLDRETQLGIEEAVRITTNVADALDYAHRQGVIHRDIKPENILLHDGRPIVADFGIALAVSAAAGGRMTETGLSLGTPHYMSPEQATGEREISARSDVYSLGSVLYEMLTGSPPHTGASAQQIIMKIVTEEAQPVTKLRKSVPPNVAAAVARAVEKLPADRFESAATFKQALENPAFATAGGGAIRTTMMRSAPGASRRAAIGSTALFAALAAVAAWGWLRPRASADTDQHVVRLWTVDGGMIVRDAAGNSRGFRAAIAPDGSSIVFNDGTPPSSQLHRKRRGEYAATPMPGTESGISPFFSPDGRWVGFITREGMLRKVPIDGGGVVTLTDGVQSAAWLDDDQIVYATRDRILRRVPAQGGASSLIDTLPVFAHSLWPLPRSTSVLLSGCVPPCTRLALYQYDFATDSLQMLVEDGGRGWYAPTGQLLFTPQVGGLFALAFDAARGTTSGGAIPIVEGVRSSEFTLSAGGDALYSIGEDGTRETELVWVSRTGTTEPIDSGWKETFSHPALAADGTNLAVSVRSPDGQAHLWVMRIGGGRQKLTFEGFINWRPQWIDGGRSLMFGRVDEAGSIFGGNIWTRQADGSAPPVKRLDVADGIWEAELSPDGAWIVYRTNDGGVNANIYARRVAGDTTSRPVVASPADERNPTLSPDGRWLAYSSNETDGRDELYVVSFPDGGARQLVSRNGGTEPRWRSDGRELYFRSNGHMMAVAATPGTSLKLGEPVALFDDGAYARSIQHRQYDVTADGRRFLMIRRLGREQASQLVYAHDFLGDLKAKMR